jgi:putative transposase
VNGRKRHLLVDTQGLVIKAKVHAGEVQDKEGAKLLLGPLAGKLPRMAKVWVDSAIRVSRNGPRMSLDGTWRW